MREKWVVPGIVFMALGMLAFLTSAEIQVEIGVLPFSFALIVLFVAGVAFLVVGITAFITNRL